MPGTVSDVSATLVASTIRRPVWGWNTRCCSAADSRAYNGTISVFGSCFFARTSAVSRISRSPLRKTRMSPGPAAHSSSTAAVIASGRSRSIIVAGPSPLSPSVPGPGPGPVPGPPAASKPAGTTSGR